MHAECMCVRLSSVFTLLWHISVRTGLLVACAHHTWHNVPLTDHHHGLADVVSALRPRGGVHGLPLDGVDDAVTFELVIAMLVVVRVHVGLVRVLWEDVCVHEVDGLVAAYRV